jgi:hypothetical protein
LVSGGVLVFVDESAEYVDAFDVLRRTGHGGRGRSRLRDTASASLRHSPTIRR